MKENMQNAVIAAFVADALSLGAHWVYDVDQISKTYGRLDQMVDPVLAPYHKGKEKGEFTHYGDQMMVLLESAAVSGKFDLKEFSIRWQALFNNYNGYVDQATKQTLENFEAGSSPESSGSLSFDLAGASRLIPLGLYHSKNREQFIDVAVQQTAMTHASPLVKKIAEWVVVTLFLSGSGSRPSVAVLEALNEIDDADELELLVRKGMDSSVKDTREAIAEFGSMCAAGAALPGAVHLIVKYEDDPALALVENINAGGDSSARGILAAAVIAANTGIGHLDSRWLADMKAFGRIKTLVSA